MVHHCLRLIAGYIILPQVVPKSLLARANAALERWEFPVIDAKRLDVRLSQLCRDPNRDEFLFQGVVIDWPDFSRLHFEFRRQSQLAYEDKEAAYMEALMTAQSAAALQANLDALNNGR